MSRPRPSHRAGEHLKEWSRRKEHGMFPLKGNLEPYPTAHPLQLVVRKFNGQESKKSALRASIEVLEPIVGLGKK